MILAHKFLPHKESVYVLCICILHSHNIDYFKLETTLLENELHDDIATAYCDAINKMAYWRFAMPAHLVWVSIRAKTSTTSKLSISICLYNIS